ncbi:MAG: FIG002781: Alpha-L-glutamate ligase family protein, partial [uncultured Rubrobacteraceae bacterium]
AYWRRARHRRGPRVLYAHRQGAQLARGTRHERPHALGEQGELAAGDAVRRQQAEDQRRARGGRRARAAHHRARAKPPGSRGARLGWSTGRLGAQAEHGPPGGGNPRRRRTRRQRSWRRLADRVRAPTHEERPRRPHAQRARWRVLLSGGREGLGALREAGGHARRLKPAHTPGFAGYPPDLLRFPAAPGDVAPAHERFRRKGQPSPGRSGRGSEPRLRQGDASSVQRRGSLQTSGHRTRSDGGPGTVLGRHPRRRVLVQRSDGSRLPRRGPGDRRRARTAGHGGQRQARAAGPERNRRRPWRAPRRDRRVPPKQYRL